MNTPATVPRKPRLAVGGFNLLVDYVKSLAWGAAILLAIVLMIGLWIPPYLTRWFHEAARMLG